MRNKNGSLRKIVRLNYCAVVLVITKTETVNDDL